MFRWLLRNGYLQYEPIIEVEGELFPRQCGKSQSVSMKPLIITAVLFSYYSLAMLYLNCVCISFKSPITQFWPLPDAIYPATRPPA